MTSRKYPFIVLTLVALVIIFFCAIPSRAPQESHKRIDSQSAAQASEAKTTGTPGPTESVAAHLMEMPLATETGALNQSADSSAKTPSGGQMTKGTISSFDVRTMGALNSVQVGGLLTIPLQDSGNKATGTVNLVQFDADGVVRIGGNLSNGRVGSFSLSQKDGMVGGRVLMPLEHLAYTITTTEQGRMLVKEMPLAEVICYPMPRSEPEDSVKEPVGEKPVGAPPELRSRPGASAVVYLDFDGAVVTDPDWNGGLTVNAAASSLSSYDIAVVWNLVKEDFAPFNVNITTVESDYLNATVGNRQRVIITPTSSWYGDYGGVAYRDSFTRAGAAGYSFNSDIPCWVFNLYAYGIADAISHEIGHTLGLQHDRNTSAPLPHDQTNKAYEYYAGHGYSSYGSYGSTGWGPIMGAAYSQSLLQWSNGGYPSAENHENDIAIIAGTEPTPLTGATNSFGYIADEPGIDRASAGQVDVIANAFSIAGIISSASDLDYYKVSIVAASQITINADPGSANYRQANLDVGIEIQDGNGAVVVSAQPEDWLNASISTTIPAGTYYLVIKGTGRTGHPELGDFGYSAYGSIGSYTISATLASVVAPTITQQPQAQNLYVGNGLSLYVGTSGTMPNFQWKKDGVNLVNNAHLSGATDAYLNIPAAEATDAGVYTVTVSNAAGSSTSNGATVAVFVPPAPTFINQPQDTVTIAGNYLSLSCYVSSVVPVSYQWYKDEQLISEQTSYYFTKSVATATDAGYYRVTATNGGGTVSSRSATVTITPATLPIFSTQPQSIDLYAGQSVSLYGYASSNAPITYQWFLNGVAINGATSNYYSIYNATLDHAGSYTIVATSPAGSVTSGGAWITVSTTLPPRITSQPYSYSYVTLGGSASFSVSAEGTGPLTYQWYRNGTAIQGATLAYYSDASITVADLGEYYVAVSNPNGTVFSDTVLLDLTPGNAPDTFWQETREVDGVIYFLFKNPAKILRYDLGTETWLAPWTLPQVATAFTIGSDTVYVAYGTFIKKYTRAFANEAAFATATENVLWLETSNNLLLTTGFTYPYTMVATYDRSTGTKIDSKQFVYSLAQGWSFSPAVSRIFGRTSGISPGDIVGLTVNTDGTLGTAADSPYHGSFPEGQRTFMLSSGTLVSDNAGIVYRTDTLYSAGSFGMRLHDAVGNADGGYTVLYGSQLTRMDQKFRRVGTLRIAAYGARLWRRDDSLFVFAQPIATGSNPDVLKVPVADIAVPAAAAPVNAVGRRVTVADAVMDENGVLYIYSKEHKNIFRWSSNQRRYVAPIGLLGTPRYLAYSAPNRSLYVDDGGTQLRSIALDTANPKEVPFFSGMQNITGMQAAGGNVLVADPSGAWATHYVLSSAGDLVDSADWNYTSRQFSWCQANNRMYFFRDNMSPNDLHFENIDTSGQIVSAGETPYHGEVITNLPIRPAPDGSVILLGSGQMFKGTDMTLSKTLPNSIVDGAWSGSHLLTIRGSGSGTEVQSWSVPGYTLERSVTLEGMAIRAFALAGDRTLVITSVEGYLQYWILAPANLSTISRYDSRNPEVPAINPADFNGDRKSDLLWQNVVTGQRRLWLMDGTVKGSEVALNSLSTDWEMIGTADFNRDGRTDILWQNTSSGERVAWLMNGSTIIGYQTIGTVDPIWNIGVLADLNLDGHPDILWENTLTGERGLWLMTDGSLTGYVNMGTLAVQWTVAGAGDFNGDGQTDLVWQNALTGERNVWLMNGTVKSSEVSLGYVALSWVIGAVADYDGDGQPDIFWQNTTTGEHAIWLMNGTTLKDYAFPSTDNLDWVVGRIPLRPAATDFNLDGSSDLVWQNATTGERKIWLMNGTAFSSEISLGTLSTDWQIACIGDLDNDGHWDIIRQNTVTGERGVWLMNDASISSFVSLGVVGLDWQIVGTGDFNNDNRTDILWQNTVTGERGIWLMFGTTLSGWAGLGNVSTTWQIAGVADFNRDDQPDIIWQNTTTGERKVWYMNGTTFGSEASFGIVGLAWKIVGAADYNGDGSVDILWQNTVTGEGGIWLLNGIDLSGYVALSTQPLIWQIAN